MLHLTSFVCRALCLCLFGSNFNFSSTARLRNTRVPYIHYIEAPSMATGADVKASRTQSFDNLFGDRDQTSDSKADVKLEPPSPTEIVKREDCDCYSH